MKQCTAMQYKTMHKKDGFRKIPTVGANGSPADKRTVDVAHFYHANFVRGHEQRLAGIKRKVRLAPP